jgi:tRNA threonylcarbamoyl adenosine modification protein (Sua5/YciO/YrdC/YwlC family)
VATPTDACHALVWQIGDREALERVRRIRALDAHHLMTLLCLDLAQLSVYAAIDTRQFRFLKEWTPGPYTFVLPATREVPKRLLHPSRRTLGVRVPQAPLLRALLETVGEPLLGTTLQLPGDDTPLSEPEDIEAQLSGRVDLVLAGGRSGLEPTTVIDLTGAWCSPLIKSGHESQPAATHCGVCNPGHSRHHAARGRSRLARGAVGRSHRASAGQGVRQSASS